MVLIASKHFIVIVCNIVSDLSYICKKKLSKTSYYSWSVKFRDITGLKSDKREY
nr:unnamed protein product [Callosobruchus chinensis]